MKKLTMLLLVAVIGTTTALAQQATATTTPLPTQELKPMHMKGDGVMMENGKMMAMKDGKMSPMNKEVTLSNGSVVTTDGTVKLQDGTSKKLKNGDCVYMDGKIESVLKKGTMQKKTTTAIHQ